jgi:hypothetical protein
MTAFDELAIATAVGTFFIVWLVWGVFPMRSRLDDQLRMLPEKKPGGAGASGFGRHRIRPAVHHRPNAHHDGGSGVIGGEPFILDHSASCASLSCCFLSASRLSCSFDHQAAHVSPIMNAGTSPFSSSRWRELLLLITRSPHHSFM